MRAENSENDLDHWFSTYGVITAERILGGYHIRLQPSELSEAVKSKSSFYRRLLEVPLKNVLNGIVLQQAHDYHIYAQKLFIDYLLSGESTKDEGTQGATTRESIENERQQLLELGEEYQHMEGEHNKLIAASQVSLIKMGMAFQAALDKAIPAVAALLGISDKRKIHQAINYALIHGDITHAHLQSNEFIVTEKMGESLKQKIDASIHSKIMEYLSQIMDIVIYLDANTHDYLERTNEMSVALNSFRKQFYESIIRVRELLAFLPEYRIDPIQDAINREPLYFDRSIGALG